MQKLNPCGPISTTKRPREPEFKLVHFPSHEGNNELAGTSSAHDPNLDRPTKRHRLSSVPTEKVIPEIQIIQLVNNKARRRRRGPPTKEEKRAPGFYDDALTCKLCDHGYKKFGGQRGASMHKCKVLKALKKSEPDCLFCGAHLQQGLDEVGLLRHILTCIAIRRLKAWKNRDGLALRESGLTDTNIGKFQFPDRRPELPSENQDLPSDMLHYLAPIEKLRGAVL